MTTLVCSSAYALDFQSSRTLSLSQSGRGGALLNDSITLNPSTMGFQPLVSLSGTFNWQPDGNLFNVSVVDGRNPLFNAGVSFTRRSEFDFFHLGLAKRVTNWLSVGTSGKRFSTRANRGTPGRPSIVGYDLGNSLTLGFPSLPVQLGVVADNLMNRAEFEPATGPRQIGGGVKVNLKSILIIYADYVQYFSRIIRSYNSYSGGLELALGGDIFLRGGLMGFREKGWSLGGGWVGPKVGLNYGYQNRKLTTGVKNFEHAVTMDVFM